MTQPPQGRPARPCFSSGPTAKRPGWTAHALSDAALGRSHRSQLGKERIRAALELTRDVLRVPSDYRIAIVPASDTGAMEMALWSLLGPRPVEVLAWESFGELWATDIAEHLHLDARVHRAPYGHLPDLTAVETANSDVVFAWNGTTSGVRVPDADWIPSDRNGLTICDATSAAFAQHLDFPKLDVITFSWQKALGGEGGHGMLILSPRAVERLEQHTPSWPVPRIFRLTKNGRLNEALFAGDTINTPSLLCIEDYLDTLRWAYDLGGLDALIARADANANALSSWVEHRAWINHLAVDAAARSNTSVCLTLEPLTRDGGDQPIDPSSQIAARLASEHVAYDIAAYRDAPPGLRIWCGATVEQDDIRLLTEWLDWAWEQESVNAPAPPSADR